MQDTALPWLILLRTHSAVQVGLLLFCRYLPFTLFGLWAGVLADRFDNRRMLMVTQIASMSVAACLAIATFAHAPLAVIYVLAACGGAGVVFDAPNRQALTYQLVGRAELAERSRVEFESVQRRARYRPCAWRRRHRCCRRRCLLSRQRGFISRNSGGTLAHA